MVISIVTLVFNWSALETLTKTSGTGGQLRHELADFQVEEVPLYPPSGEGEYLFIQIEKIGHTTAHVVRTLSEQLGVKDKNIGVAGLKDRHAITKQWLSLPIKYEKRLDRFHLDGVRIIDTGLHDNKLSIGHLKGNQFTVRVREAEGKFEEASQILDVLKIQGIPNYFGPQRFGLHGLNAEEGVRVLRGESGLRDPRIRRFLMSSVQSLVFNQFLSLRLQRGIFDALLVGDMAKKHDTGGVFMVEDAELESLRAGRGEVSATGTLFGKKTKPLTGDAGMLEQEALAQFGLSAELFAARRGDRRLTRVFLSDASIKPEEDGYTVTFALPKGSFATSVLREMTKNAVDTAEPDEPQEAQGLEESGEDL